jgi:hypothetical protein
MMALMCALSVCTTLWVHRVARSRGPLRRSPEAVPGPPAE